jgi:DNA-directed RNA polymerase specialized sigma24 family protein
VVGSSVTELEKLDSRQGRIVESRYSGGLSIDETAEAIEHGPDVA